MYKTQLRQRPTYKEIIGYVEHGDPKIKYPNRIATFLSKTPEMSQFLGDGGSSIDFLQQQQNIVKQQILEMEMRNAGVSTRELKATGSHVDDPGMQSLGRKVEEQKPIYQSGGSSNYKTKKTKLVYGSGPSASYEEDANMKNEVGTQTGNAIVFNMAYNDNLNKPDIDMEIKHKEHEVEEKKRKASNLFRQSVHTDVNLSLIHI